MLYGDGDYQYELVEGWAKWPEGWCNGVSGVSVDSQDRVYASSNWSLPSTSDHPVMVFDREGNLLSSWGNVFSQAHGRCYIALDGSIYCADRGNHTVCKFTPEGKLLQVLGNKDQPSDTGDVEADKVSYDTVKRGGPPFNKPTSVALSSSGEIYVSDGYGNARVHKFTSDGKLLFSWGEPGDAPGEFRLSHAVFVDKYDRVWVADRENNRIQIFNAQGKFLSQWTDVICPADLCIDDQGTVYVSELRGLRVSIFTLDGRLLARWGSQGQNKETDLFVAPHGIAVDSRGDLYIGEVANTFAKVDRGSRTLMKFAKRARN